MIREDIEMGFTILAVTAPIWGFALLIIAQFIPLKYALIFFKPRLNRIKRNIPATLTAQSDYYNKLSLAEKERFEERVFEFIIYKEFDKLGEFEISEEMKISIAATAIQITFGFKREYEYKAFKRIIISQKDYFSMLTKAHHKGETNPAREYVALSWESFQEGTHDPHDSINVGLHEFAHAYFFNNVKGYINPSFNESISSWHHLVVNLASEQNTHDFLRKYAFANKMEFFAVSMEYFFEKPFEFNEHLPSLFELLTRILMQDPLKPNYGIAR